MTRHLCSSLTLKMTRLMHRADLTGDSSTLVRFGYGETQAHSFASPNQVFHLIGYVPTCAEFPSRQRVQAARQRTQIWTVRVVH